MIYCSQCGTQNRDGSKFCSNCAARLAPPSGLICPMCSTANPVETVFCNNCGARLVPLIGGPDANRRDQSPPIKGLSLPTRSTPPAEESDDIQEPVTKEKIEDWLAKLRAAPPEEVEAPAPQVDSSSTPPPTPSSTVSDFDFPPPPASPPPSEQIPTWVKPARAEEFLPEAIDSAETAEQIEPLPRASNPAEPLPDWLKELDGQTQLPQVDLPEPENDLPTDLPLVGETQLPAWLQQGLKPESQPEEKPPPAQIPLQQVQEPQARVEEPGTVLAAKPIPEPEPLEPVKAEEIPPWVSQLKPAQQTESPVAAQAEPTEIPDADEMSDWLRTPAALVPETTSSEKPSSAIELEGPLASLRGVLPLAMAMTEAHTVSPIAPGERKDGAHLFDDILTAPTLQAAHPRRRTRRGVPTMKALIYLLLALAVIVPFFVPVNMTGATLPISGTRAAEFFDQVQALPSDATVLLAFDYDPSAAGEMDLVASAIVRHLVQRRIKILALSTLETGPLIAQRVLDSATAGASDYRYGAQYLNLGYLAGHESGLAQLATQGLPLGQTDFGQGQIIGRYPIVANIKTMGSLALVVDLAGTEEPLKNWVEYFQPLVNGRLAVGGSAAVEPKARAYRDSRQLVALVSGAVGAAQYEILTSQPGTALTRLAAQSVAQLVLIGIVVLGNIVYWVGRLQPKEKQSNG